MSPDVLNEIIEQKGQAVLRSILTEVYVLQSLQMKLAIFPEKNSLLFR